MTKLTLHDMYGLTPTMPVFLLFHRTAYRWPHTRIKAVNTGWKKSQFSRLINVWCRDFCLRFGLLTGSLHCAKHIQGLRNTKQGCDCVDKVQARQTFSHVKKNVIYRILGLILFFIFSRIMSKNFNFTVLSTDLSHIFLNTGKKLENM